MNMNDVLQELQKQYLADLPVKIEKIESLIKEQNVEKLRTEFHNLKGSGRTYGIPELSELGACIESICKLKPSDIFSRVSDGAELLRQIHKDRLQAKAFVLDKNDSYLKLKKLASTTPAP